jgi:peroxiredoxin
MTTRKELVARRQRQAKTKTFLLIGGGLLFLAALGLLFSERGSSTQAVGRAQVGKPLDDFSLTDIEGNTVRLSDYEGKVVLINAWATWCPPCIAEMPDLNAYYQAHQEDGFIILAINAGDSAEQAAEFADQKGLTFPVLLDTNTRLLSSLGINSYPTSILVGQDGIVKKIHVGMLTPQALEDEITPYLRQE